MNPNDVAPMVMAVVLFLTAGGVILLRPISKRLGAYLEMLTEERRRSMQQGQQSTDPRLLSALDNLDRRLGRLEERQDFTDDLLRGREQQQKLGPHVDRQ
jgi:hypothetical protein